MCNCVHKDTVLLRFCAYSVQPTLVLQDCYLRVMYIYIVYRIYIYIYIYIATNIDLPRIRILGSLYLHVQRLNTTVRAMKSTTPLDNMDIETIIDK